MRKYYPNYSIGTDAYADIAAGSGDCSSVKDYWFQ